MIHLDTHVVVWLTLPDHDRLGATARSLIEAGPVAVSPMVELELAYLFELGRFARDPALAVAELRRVLGVVGAEESFAAAVRLAATPVYSFTRDPFDRVIAAHAATAGARLVTKDRSLREHCDFAVWD